jgi:hypothetical protein
MSTFAHVRGPFEVTITPQPPTDGVGDPAIGRMALAKHFHGPLEATSRGEMLSWRDPALKSGGYVAMERVTGTLGDATGTFLLQHSGTLIRGAATLALSVVPDSGTGALAGLTGTMKIELDDGAHSYDFEYELP